MDFINIIILISAVVNLFLGIFIYYRGGNKLIKKSYGYLAFSLFLWAIAKVIYRAAPTVESSIFWDKILYVVPVYVVLSVLYFTFIFPEGNKPRNKHLIPVLSLAAFLMASLILFSDKIIQGVIFHAGDEKEMLYGSLYLFYSLYIFGFFVWSWFVMVAKIKRSKGKIKTQASIVFIGIIVPSLLSMVTNILLLKL